MTDLASPPSRRARCFARIHDYARLMRLDKPIGILLLLWPTLWGVWLAADGRPAWTIVLIFVSGTVLMRSAGCVINDYADRDFDPEVARTKQRPLAARRVSVREALTLFVVLVLLAFLVMLPILTWPLLAMAIAALFLAASYPFTKRFFAVPQAYLGVAFGFGIPMAWLAQTGAVAPAAWMLLVANIFWAIAYDTEYAMVDRADDLRIGIRSSAITFGRFDVAAVAACYALALALLVVVGQMLASGWPYFLALLLAGVIAVTHVRRIAAREPGECFRVFLDNNRIGAIVFAGIVIDSLLS
ncbi:MAG TPA: 4-hydroxybenzoate octaprenyltransferase [Rhodocyclaceae bacterium]